MERGGGRSEVDPQRSGWGTRPVVSSLCALLCPIFSSAPDDRLDKRLLNLATILRYWSVLAHASGWAESSPMPTNRSAYFSYSCLHSGRRLPAPSSIGFLTNQITPAVGRKLARTLPGRKTGWHIRPTALRAYWRQASRSYGP